MSDGDSVSPGLRERLLSRTEERLGQALSDLLDSSLLTSALTHAFDAREKAAQAQELAMGALNLPSAADIERLTRRLRSVSQRLEAIEDVVDRIDRSLQGPTLERRLTAIEEQLRALVAAGDSSGIAARGPSGTPKTQPTRAGRAPRAAAKSTKTRAASKSTKNGKPSSTGTRRSS